MPEFVLSHFERAAQLDFINADEFRRTRSDERIAVFVLSLIESVLHILCNNGYSPVRDSDSDFVIAAVADSDKGIRIRNADFEINLRQRALSGDLFAVDQFGI